MLSLHVFDQHRTQGITQKKSPYHCSENLRECTTPLDSGPYHAFLQLHVTPQMNCPDTSRLSGLPWMRSGDVRTARPRCAACSRSPRSTPAGDSRFPSIRSACPRAAARARAHRVRWARENEHPKMINIHV